MIDLLYQGDYLNPSRLLQLFHESIVQPIQERCTDYSGTIYSCVTEKEDGQHVLITVLNEDYYPASSFIPSMWKDDGLGVMVRFERSTDVVADELEPLPW